MIRLPPRVALLVLASSAPATSAQVAPSAGSAAVLERARVGPPSTQLKAGREVLLLGVGGGLQGAFRLVPRPRREVPASGLSAAEIAWSWDRDAVGARSDAADRASGWTRDGALAFLLTTMVVTAGRDAGWRELARRGLVYTEAALISNGLTNLGKRVLGRPRPFVYLPSSERPSGSAFDVSKGGVFESMPSGHASSAWTAASLGMAEHLLSRPDAKWPERVAVGVIGGGLAGATSALRVAAGQHFPSDVVVSTGIGLLTGVTIPLLHRGSRPLPTRRAWLEMSGGAAAGALAGILVALAY